MKNINLKQIGQNIIITIDNETITRKIADKEAREAIKEAVISYNKKATKKGEKEITAFLNAKEEKKCVKEVAVVKAKKIDKKKIAAVKNKTVSTSTKVLAKEEAKKVEKKVATVSPYKRSGEY